MMTDFSLRKIIASDNDRLAQIIRDSFIEFDAPKTGTVFSDPTTDKLFELFEGIPQSSFFIAEKDSIVLGCCGIYPTQGLPAGYVELVKFYLGADARGKGIGKALFESSIQEAKDLGYSHLYIESQPSFSKALKIYEKYGFEYLSKPLGNSGHDNCDIWMLKKL